MSRQLLKTQRQSRRVRRVRKKVTGLPGRPRLAVSRSNRHIYAQIIDDTSGRTLCAAGTQSKDLPTEISYGGNVKAAAVIGKALGEKARKLGIETVCFDRRGRKYHGRIKALAEATREAGLRF
jgi:large subunit ribosomal protein L18